MLVGEEQVEEYDAEGRAEQSDDGDDGVATHGVGSTGRSVVGGLGTERHEGSGEGRGDEDVPAGERHTKCQGRPRNRVIALAVGEVVVQPDDRDARQEIDDMGVDRRVQPVVDAAHPVRKQPVE